MCRDVPLTQYTSSHFVVLSANNIIVCVACDDVIDVVVVVVVVTIILGLLQTLTRVYNIIHFIHLIYTRIPADQRLHSAVSEQE